MTEDKIRRFRAYYVKRGEATGFGIVEHGAHWNSEILAVQSLYEPRNMSNRDATIAIYQRIYNSLADEEFAVLQISQFSERKSWHVPYENRIKINRVSYRTGAIYHASLLAKDALRRGDSITEVFDEPMRFKVNRQRMIEEGTS